MDLSHPCPECQRYTCRCEEVTARDRPHRRPELPPPADWTPWWTSMAANA